MERPELLAPAGDWEAMRAGVVNGADAVYFGLDQFNARHRATNFTVAELPRVMAYLHAHNVKGFVTFNTLIFSEELEGAVEYVKAIAAAGVDAVIVQDLGVAKLIQALVPSLHVHGSTQMTLTEAEGIKFVAELGVKRVVLARELGLAEIGKIRAATEMPLEVFVHGALCVAYSGQCLTSESLGGRSANRGQCAQACRLPYQLIVDGVVKELGEKQYLLSPTDLAAHELIGELTKLGVASFKVEGRLKSAHYVAATTQTYRGAIDAAAGGVAFEVSARQKHVLEQTFSRGFSQGFLSGVNHQALVPAVTSKARGSRVGEVISKNGCWVVVRIDDEIRRDETRRHEAPPHTKDHEDVFLLKAGDGVLFEEGREEAEARGGRVYGVKGRGEGKELELSFGEEFDVEGVSMGAVVWKTDDPAIKKALENSFARDAVVRRVRLEVTVRARVGEPLEVIGREEGGRTARAVGKVLEKANKFPVTREGILEQIDRLGETPFVLGELVVEESGGPMVPKSVLNELRRSVCEELAAMRGRGHMIVEEGALERLRAEAIRIIPAQTNAPASEVAAAGCETGIPIENQKSKIENQLHVLVRTMAQLEAVLAHGSGVKASTVYADFEEVRRYPEAVAKCRAAGVKIGLATLRIVKPGEEGFLKQVSDCGPDLLLVRCLGAIHYYRQAVPTIPLVGDYALNIANELTADIFRAAGLVRMVPSYDLNWMQLAALLRRFDPLRLESVIHQHMPMFHMEHCVFAHTLSTGKDYRDCGRPCEKHRVELTDRVGEPHPLIPDVGCRNTLFNARAQTAAEYVPELLKMGIRHFRVELLRESGEETGRVMDRYSRLLRGEEKPLEVVRSLRVLNQLGVTRGTMAHE
jgi:putative protease